MLACLRVVLMLLHCLLAADLCWWIDDMANSTLVSSRDVERTSVALVAKDDLRSMCGSQCHVVCAGEPAFDPVNRRGA